MTVPDCPLCGARSWTPGIPSYGHVHRARGQLPAARHSDSHTVTRSYAVGMSGRVPQVWVFFDHLEPAVAFGRAARMSGTGISSCSVYAAARELRYDDDLSCDTVTLHIDLGADLRDHQAERPVLERWLQGTDPGSAYFRQPDRPS